MPTKKPATLSPTKAIQNAHSLAHNSLDLSDAKVLFLYTAINGWENKYTLIQVFVFSSLELFSYALFRFYGVYCFVVSIRIKPNTQASSKPSENSIIFLCFIWRTKYYLKWNSTDSLPNGHMIIRNVYYALWHL